MPLPLTRDAVLVGGGHAHALVLRRWGMRPLPGARLTLIDPNPTAPYTGMLPGHLAGHYDRHELDIDLVRLARFAGARLVIGRVVALDPEARTVVVETALGRRTIEWDVASLDIGIHSEMPELPGFDRHAVAAKPLGALARRWATHLAALRDGTAADGLAVIGGGVAGVELSMAMAHGAAVAAGRPVPMTVIESGRALSHLGHAARGVLRGRMADLGIALIELADVARVEAGAIVLADGRHIAAGFVTGAAGARPHAWLEGAGLPLTDGFVTVDASLRSTGARHVLAAGDCAHMAHAPRPKAGVYAVRAAPVLHANLRAAMGAGPWRRYRPQRDYLKLISTGDKSATAEKFGLCLSGPWLWRLKDRIDRRFMDRLRDLPRMPVSAPPFPAAAGLRAALGGGQAPCGGCAAKAGRATLGAALAGLQPVPRDDVESGAGDDAAVLRIGDVRQVLTLDVLRAVTADPWMHARIAAEHALGDVWAMGADPQAALAAVTLPRLSPVLERRTLTEIMDAAGAALADAGAGIVGGHTATGAELSVGFALTGLVGRAVMLDAGRPGDALILTAPLGTGTILAAEMEMRAQGAWVAAALDEMARPQRGAAAILKEAHAMTDVTGFGLAGHLMGLLEASGLAARLDLHAIPLLDGAAELAARGVRSTLWEQNSAVADRMDMPDDPAAALLFDPQTAGGLLAAVAPETARGLVDRLVAKGHRAAIIGTLERGAPRISVRGPD